MNYRCKFYEQFVDSATRKVVRSETRTGTMIGIGQDYEEFDNGPGNYPIAIILTDDGKIATCHTSMVFDIEHEHFQNGGKINGPI